MEVNIMYNGKNHSIDIQDVTVVILNDALLAYGCEEIRNQYDTYSLASFLYSIQYECNEEKLDKGISDLLNNYSINSKSIILLINPENDLHPRKQVDFIKKVFELKDKCKCKVLIFTNSPFVLKACVYYSKKCSTDILKIYVENDNILDVTNSRDAAFKSLTEPYLDLTEEDD